MSEPMEYDLTEIDDLMRLIKETEGYMSVSIQDGTDRKGREHALNALSKIVAMGPLYFKLLCRTLNMTLTGRER